MIFCQNILVSGGAGFIGSNFISLFLKENPLYNIVNLDKLTYAGNLENTKEVQGNERYHFIQGDICDAQLVRNIFEKHRIDAVVHFAAESHVDNSIAAPDHFIKTNIEGTFVLLEAAKNYWMDKGHASKKGFEHARFHHISTDEVYGSLGKRGLFTEHTPYAPNSPYSASKAAADFLVRSYHHTYGLNTVTTNCSNNYGPKQHDEKLIPTIIRKALAGESIPIYGKGLNVRDWLYVRDHCEAIKLVFERGRSGETYLIGGHNEHTNLSVAHTICELLDEMNPKGTGNYKDQITFVKDRPGHDYRYAIDSDKIKKELDWQPKESFSSGLQKTVAWYMDKYQKE